MQQVFTKEQEKEILNIVGLFKYEVTFPASLFFEFKDIDYHTLLRFYEWLFNRLSYMIEVKTNYDDLLSYPNFIAHEIKNTKGEIMKEQPKNNFEEYGFTGDFEGEILKQIDDEFFGWVKDKKDPIFNNVMTWNDKGNAYVNNGVTIHEYNLTPIKKQWYEKEENFPCLVIDKQNHNEIRVVKENRGFNWEVFRPATKEEVLNLIADEG